jgi:hypothetical protein
MPGGTVRTSRPRRRSPRRRLVAALGTLLLVSLAGCSGGSEQGSDEASPVRDAESAPAVPKVWSDVDPDDFVERIDNPYLPLEPGTTLRYEGNNPDDEEIVEVTDRTREILGVTVTVVRDRVFEGGDLVERTDDWYAQDREGNVWYFGEDAQTIDHGEVVSTEGSWEAGRDGARPGIVMLAHPRVGDTYDQEVAPGVAEDRGEVLRTDDTITVPFGSFDDVLRIRDTTPLEPDVVEHKYYGRGVGLVAEREIKGGDERFELVAVERP